MVYDYDLFNVSATGVGTTATPLLLNGTANANIIPPASYQVKVHNLVITNTGSSSALLKLQAYNESTTVTTVLYEVSIGAGASVILDGSKFEIVIPPGNEFQAVASASSFDVYGSCYFSKF